MHILTAILEVGYPCKKRILCVDYLPDSLMSDHKTAMLKTKQKQGGLKCIGTVKEILNVQTLCSAWCVALLRYVAGK